MQSHLQSGAVEFLLGGTVKEKGWDSFCFSRWSPSEDYLEMLCSLVGSCVMSLGRLLVARCEQKEFKIDASVVAPVSCSCRRGAVPGRPAAAALLHASRDQRPAGPVCQTQRPACNSKTSKRCSIFIFGSGQICSLTYYTDGEEIIMVGRLDQQEDCWGWVPLIWAFWLVINSRRNVY